MRSGSCQAIYLLPNRNLDPELNGRMICGMTDQGRMSCGIPVGRDDFSGAPFIVPLYFLVNGIFWLVVAAWTSMNHRYYRLSRVPHRVQRLGDALKRRI